jgi:hypothetical protein
MKIIVAFLLFLSFTSFNATAIDVYICGPNGAKKYHYTKNCRGLSACKHEIYKKTLKEARGYGLTLCGWED